MIDAYKKMSLEEGHPKNKYVVCFWCLTLRKVWVCVQDQGKESCEGCHNYVPCDPEQSLLKKSKDR